MGEFNFDDHYIYYYGQESLRRNGVTLIVNKSLKCNTWVQSQKRQILAVSKENHFNIIVIQVYALITNAKWFCEDLKDLLELTLKKDVLYIIGEWSAKGGSQEIPGVTSKFGPAVQNEAGQRLA